MPAPVNVKLQEPTEPDDDWPEQAKQWKNLNQALGGDPDFYPLTVKAAYVIGVIHDICVSVTLLLKAPNITVTYIPAYGVFASGVELLGRCLTGNSTTWGSSDDLKEGFRWLEPSVSDDTDVVITTSNHAYTLENLVALRHFAAHGQATSRPGSTSRYQFGSIDTEILSHMPLLVKNGMERYWSQLRVMDELCDKLAQANIIALRGWPVFNSWKHFDWSSVTDMFKKFDWHV